MRKVILVLASVFALGAAKAQDNAGFHFAGGVRLAMPIGTFGDSQGFGFGAELQGEYGFAESVTGVISAGYTNFTAKDYTFAGMTIPGASFGVIPVMAGVRFYPSTQFFVGAKAGVAIGTATGSGANFSYEPQVGYNAEKFQVSVGYNAISGAGVTLGSIGLSALYKFN